MLATLCRIASPSTSEKGPHSGHLAGATRNKGTRGTLKLSVLARLELASITT